MSQEQLACVYAALMLNDAGMPTTAVNMKKVVAAAGITVRPTLPVMVEHFLQKKPISALMSGAASKVPEVPAGGAAPAAKDEKKKEDKKDDKKGDKKDDKKKEEKKKPEPEPEDDGGMLGLFD